MRCFAYGSNMSSRRLNARVSARFVTLATLPAHRLAFHKLSRGDGSGKCDAWYTGDPADQVLGVVYEVADWDKPVLDGYEGLGAGYDEKWTHVRIEAGEHMEVQLYVATLIDPEARPFTWYRDHVLIGAREYGLPGSYQQWIASVPAWEDPNQHREARERAVHR